MPRPKKPGAPEPKRRSRKGCWPCKSRKVKCGEEKPSCSNCRRQGETCDYSIRLNWEGRTKKKSISGIPQSQSSLSGLMARDDSTNQTTQYTGSNTLQSGTSLEDDSPSKAVTPLDYCGQKTAHSFPRGAQPQNYLGRSTINYPGTPEGSLIRSGTIQPPQRHGLDLVGQSTEHALLSNVSEDGLENPHLSSLGHLGSYRDSSPTSLSLPSPSERPASAVRRPPVTQQMSYLRQTRPRDIELEVRPTQEDTSLCKSLVQSGHSEGFPVHEVFPPANAEKTPGSHVLSYSADKAPSSLGDITQNSALIPPIYKSAVHQAPVHSPSSRPQMSHGLLDLSGAFTSSGLESTFNSAETVDNFGLDCGHPDLDLNRNDDAIAIKTVPSLDTGWQNNFDARAPKLELGLQKSETVFAKGGYYSFPVHINIPRQLTPLPAQLLDNPMNLLYFHHFLNHTARILVPHDCPDNPFRVVLPSMAVEDTNLLNLLLAYSASHRARLLGHDEPSHRIAHWVRDVFPALRQAVDNVDEKTGDMRVATAIMLTSLKIISPSTFDVPIPWQDHLKVARNLFVARGGTQPGQPTTRVGYFLARWLAYLDILGSLSCRKNDLPLFNGSYWAARAVEKGSSDKSGFHVDCFTGFSPLCSSLLARLGELTHHSYSERFDENGVLQWDFNPSAEIKAEGQRLLDDMKDSLLHEYNFSIQHQTSRPDDPEMAAFNHAFHWAGVIHLYRRVLDRGSEDEEVIVAVNSLLDTLSQVRRGGSAEVCLLFPIFTAGCETQDLRHRRDILERIKSFEGVGMKQIRNARKLMEKSWAEDLPWILLTQGEFLG